ncbi:MAG: hypothetical protein IJI22_02280 [Bacilli bacterium]|nr:hypothetical protein [Bacilli bacterium]
MAKRRISIGTIAFFVSIGVLRGCQEYRIEQQEEANKIYDVPEIKRIEEIYKPAEKNDAKELKLVYKK